MEKKEDTGMSFEVHPVLRALGFDEKTIKEMIAKFMPQIDDYIKQKVKETVSELNLQSGAVDDEYIEKKVQDVLQKVLPPFFEEFQRRISELLGPPTPKSSVETPPPADGQQTIPQLAQLQQLALLAELFKGFTGGGGGDDLEKMLNKVVALRQIVDAITPKSPWDEIGPKLLVNLLLKLPSLNKEEKELVKKVLEGESE